MVILGIDPGYAIVGYGVIEAKNSRYRPLEHGAVTTKSTQDLTGAWKSSTILWKLFYKNGSLMRLQLKSYFLTVTKKQPSKWRKQEVLFCLRHKKQAFRFQNIRLCK